MSFSKLGLTEPLVRAITQLGYESTTPIQAQAIPIALAGDDLIGCAQTGTGKTAAFTLPLLDHLYRELAEETDADRRPKKKRGRGRTDGRPPRALVLSPTRELAAQIEQSLQRYGRHLPVRSTVVFGGVSQYRQVKDLEWGVDALIATPGRLIDLMGQGFVDLSRIELLVLDEADQMLDLGFLPALERIIKSVPAERQTLMFSATMPPAIRKLAGRWLSDPESVDLTPATAPGERISQTVHFVDKNRKAELLSHYLKETKRRRTLVFSRTKHGADKLVRRLTKDGVVATAIHGNKSQNARNRALARFKGANPPVLVATDIAARGIDVRDVSHVVNFDLPETPETYVHRIGRSGRAGASGVAISFCSADERPQLKQIERLTKKRLVIAPTVAGFEPTESVKPASRSKSNPKHRRRAGSPRGKTATRGDAPTGRKRTKTSKGAATDKAKSAAESSSSAKPASGKPKTPKPSVAKLARKRRRRRARPSRTTATTA